MKDEVTKCKDWTTEPHVWGRKGDPTTFMVSAEDQDQLLHELIGAAGEVALITNTQDSRIVRLGMAWRKWRNAGGKLPALAPTQSQPSTEELARRIAEAQHRGTGPARCPKCGGLVDFDNLWNVCCDDCGRVLRLSSEGELDHPSDFAQFFAARSSSAGRVSMVD